MNDENIPAGQTPEPVVPAPATAPLAYAVPSDLDAQLKSLRKRTNVLIAIVIVMIVLLVCAIGAAVVVIGGVVSQYGMVGGSMEDQGPAIEQAVVDAYGDNLQDVQVREIQVDDVGVPFDFLVDSGWSSYALTYSLKDQPVSFATVVSDVSSLGYAGVLPTEGSLSNRMSYEDLTLLLKAWAAESSKPIGGVTRYADFDMMMGDGSSVPTTITSGGAVYATNELWAASEGQEVEGDSLSAMDPMGVDMLIFHQDPKTRQFEFIGREAGMGNMYF